MEKPTSLKTESLSIKKIITDAFKELAETLTAFIKAPRALWGINLPYILEGLAYFGILTILGKYCSENVTLSDPQAGWVYGGVTGGITFAMLILGGVTDKIGVRTSLALALGMMAVGRIFVSLSGTLSLPAGMGSPMFFMMAIGLLLMVIAYGLYQPAAYAGVKRYTNAKTAAMGYAVLYALMNLGAFLSGYIASFTRQNSTGLFPPNGLTAVFWIFTLLTVVAFCFSLLINTKRVDMQAVERVRQEAGGRKEKEKTKETGGEGISQRIKIDNRLFILYVILFIVSSFLLLFFSIKGYKSNIRYIFVFLSTLFVILAGWEFLRHRPKHPFRDMRFVFFIFILIPVQTLFAHNWLTIPYYLDRAFYGSWVSDYFEVLSNINPLLIFIITPIIAGLTARAKVYRMMIIGTFVMAAPTFLLAFGTHAWLFIIYILIMSVGEAMWQPRFLQWVAEIAPEGQTGAYMGIGQFPWFLTKLITSLYSGFFVENYLPKPESGMESHSSQMWLIYAFIAMISPCALWLAKTWMVKGMKEKHNAESV